MKRKTRARWGAIWLRALIASKNALKALMEKAHKKNRKDELSKPARSFPRKDLQWANRAASRLGWPPARAPDQEVPGVAVRYQDEQTLAQSPGQGRRRSYLSTWADQIIECGSRDIVSSGSADIPRLKDGSVTVAPPLFFADV